jgi:hypothetical protein
LVDPVTMRQRERRHDLRDMPVEQFRDWLDAMARGFNRI